MLRGFTFVNSKGSTASPSLDSWPVPFRLREARLQDGDKSCYVCGFLSRCRTQCGRLYHLERLERELFRSFPWWEHDSGPLGAPAIPSLCPEGL